MTLEIRRFRDDELEQAWELDRQAFNVPASRRESFFAKAVADRFIGAFDVGRAVAQAEVLPLVHSFGGKFVQSGGVASVVVEPEYRGQGLASTVMRALLEGMRESGDALSSLYPANLRLYRQLGWELAGSYAIRQIQARHLLLLDRPAPGEVRRAEPADLPAIRECYRRFALGVSGMHDGDARWWELENEFGSYYAYVAVDSNGEVCGALVYKQISDPGGGYYR
ncbi:MAG: GNAT family N-acetyltransferase, partial [Myxococcota bacterium]